MEWVPLCSIIKWDLLRASRISPATPAPLRASSPYLRVARATPAFVIPANQARALAPERPGMRSDFFRTRADRCSNLVERGEARVMGGFVVACFRID